jgi:hypothetical protein
MTEKTLTEEKLKQIGIIVGKVHFLVLELYGELNAILVQKDMPREKKEEKVREICRDIMNSKPKINNQADSKEWNTAIANVGFILNSN